MKQKCGIIEKENYNKPKSEDVKQPQCPPKKEKVTEEYRKYQEQNLSSVEEEYLESIKNIHSSVKKKGKN